DYVIVLNADKVKFSGSLMAHDKNEQYTTKMAKKTHKWHTQWPGGLRELTAIPWWGTQPEGIFLKAVKRMMPKRALGKRMRGKLKLFNGSEHPHQSQQPTPFPDHLLPTE